MITAEEIPAWVPPAVKSMALVNNFGGDVRTRLLIDDRMESVWTELKQACLAADKKDENATATAINSFERSHHLSTWDISDENVSVHDQACAILFSYAALELTISRNPWIFHKKRIYGQLGGCSQIMQMDFLRSYV